MKLPSILREGKCHAKLVCKVNTLGLQVNIWFDINYNIVQKCSSLKMATKKGTTADLNLYANLSLKIMASQ